jgi:2-polyprenyl-6-methoxyphenol hydroxylase-like FAD-dependent oxidoreductase
MNLNSDLSSTLSEPSRTLPVAGAYDVVVTGGGIAGLAAAVAAARNGASVCLLERTFSLGGLATSSNVIVWLPLCDGRGRQMCGGLAEEMLRLSVADLGRDRPKACFGGIPACWQPGGDPEARKKHRYLVVFNPDAYLLALEAWVINAGVKLLYDTRLCAVRRDGDHITHAIVENKSGRTALACRTIVDASGDADVCQLAGERTESLDSNVLAGWFYYLRDDELHLDMLSNAYSPAATREGGVGPFFRGDDAESATAHVLGTRELTRARLAALRAEHSTSDIQVFGLPTLPAFRMTRRLVSGFSLGERNRFQYFPDTVGLLGDWRKSGQVYAIPYRTLCAAGVRNLLVAGRCISADTTIWDVTRSIPGCAVSGQAAGTAAAMAVARTGGDAVALPVAALRQQLAAQGVLLDSSLVRPNEEEQQK